MRVTGGRQAGCDGRTRMPEALAPAGPIRGSTLGRETAPAKSPPSSSPQSESTVQAAHRESAHPGSDPSRSPLSSLIPTTRLIGRADELGTLMDKVAAGARLVTIVGPPGIGKTRIATELAIAWTDRSPEGLRRHTDEPPVVFCDLRNIGSAKEFSKAVQRALRIRSPVEEGSLDSVQQIGDALAARGACLVVLDNFERLVDAGALVVASWLRLAPNACFVVTSRRVLGVSAEEVFELGPLMSPRAKDDVDSDAMRLFLDRALRVEPAVRVRPDLVNDLVALVQRLEGIPLALELAGAQMRHMTPATLRKRLGARVISLATPHRDIEPQHRTLRNAIESSWNLLSSRDQSTLAQLTIFRTAFRTEDAERVVRHSDHHGDSEDALAAAPVREAIGHLRDASLLRRIETPEGESRWDMYQAIREFAEERLDPADREGARARHAAHLVRWGEQTASQRAATSSINALALAQDDLAFAFEWLVQQAATDDLLRLALVLFEGIHSLAPAAAEQYLTRALSRTHAATRDVSTALRGRVHLARSRARRLIGRYANAEDDLDSARKLLGSTGSVLAEIDYEAGLLAVVTGDAVTARMLLERALANIEDAHHPRLEGWIRHSLGWVLGNAFFDREASRQHRRAIALLDSVDVRGAARARIFDCFDRLRFGEPSGVLDEVEALRAQATRWRDRPLEVEARITAMRAHADAGDSDAAHTEVEEAVRIARAAGLDFEGAAALINQGLLFESEGDLHTASRTYRQALARTHAGEVTQLAGLLWALTAGPEAGMDRPAEAEASLTKASAFPWPSLPGIIGVQRRRIALAKAVLAWSEGNRPKVDRLRTWAADFLPPAGAMTKIAKTDGSILMRHLTRCLAHECETFESRLELRVGRGGHSFQRGTGPIHPVATGAAAQRVLAALAVHRDEAPGQVLSASDLLARGWPGERVQPRAGLIRVYNVVSRLRRAGLDDLLETVERGYRLEPRVAIRLIDLSPDLRSGKAVEKP